MRTLICTNGETCYAEECVNAEFCMHLDEAADMRNCEPDMDDTVHACPDCDTPNQFGELCFSCQRERDLGYAENRL